MQADDDMPRWDEAIAGMVKEEFRNKNAPLVMTDFRRLAKDYDFRLDDIMETMFLMVMHEAWAYQASASDQKELTHETLIEYCTKKRLSEDDLKVFNGTWMPIQGS
ncbi:MAG: hypothetical protein KDJ38_02550 [Gammaproteobacteria bacterium]|nr:hypothetical protein [Gammaproteobacteria bacterium]